MGGMRRESACFSQDSLVSEKVIENNNSMLVHVFINTQAFTHTQERKCIERG